MHSTSMWLYLDMDLYNLSLCHLHENRIEEALSILRELADRNTSPELSQMALNLIAQVEDFLVQTDRQQEQ